MFFYANTGRNKCEDNKTRKKQGGNLGGERERIRIFAAVRVNRIRRRTQINFKLEILDF